MNGWNAEGDHEGAVMGENSGSDEQRNKDRHAGDEPPKDTASNHPSSKVSTLPLAKYTLGVAGTFTLSLVAHRWLRTSDSFPLDAVANHQDHSLDNISSQPFSTPIWPATLFLSLCANIYCLYFILTKAYSQSP